PFLDATKKGKALYGVPRGTFPCEVRMRKKRDDCLFTQIFIFILTDLSVFKLPFLTFLPMFICVHPQFIEQSPKPAFLNFFFLLSSSYGKVMTFLNR
ncbi:MAG TPA: hypothetical protein VF905_00975, partial [Nitrospirota bacterium]